MKNYILLNNQIMERKENGSLSFEKDLEALDSFFKDHVNKSTQFFHNASEKMHFMIDKGYYFNFFNWYSEDQITEIYNLAYAQKFRFKSFMAASKFYSSYAMRDAEDTVYLERYEDRVVCVALYLAQSDFDFACKFMLLCINQIYQPATPTFLNAGKLKGGELVSCFLDEIGDSLAGIKYAQQSAMILSSKGGGVAFNISKVRARGESIRGLSGRANGVLPVMKIFEDIFSYADQLGQREGAGAVYLNIFHLDIEEFLDCKKINADEKTRIKSLSLGVIIPDLFMKLAVENKPFYAFGPHSVYTEFGVILDDLSEDELIRLYPRLLENKNILKKKLDPREMLVKIASIQKESGYPYLFYSGNAQRGNPLRQLGKVKFSNLCTEIMQISTETKMSYPTYNEKQECFEELGYYGLGISCNLGSLNAFNLLYSGLDFPKHIDLAMRSLSIVSDKSFIQEVPSIAKANQQLRAVGLGLMDLHGFMASHKIMYGSPQSVVFVNILFMAINFYSIRSSMEQAKESGNPFKGFDKSEYAVGGTYFDTYLKPGDTSESISNYCEEYEHIIQILLPKEVQKILDSISIPTYHDWEVLKQDVQTYGLYNAYRMAIAPNQSTSYIMNSTASVMPIVDQVEVRDYGNSTTYYPMPHMTEDNALYFASAYDIDQAKVLAVIGTIQKHVDQGISCIVHVTGEQTTRDISKLFLIAYNYGLKSLYYTRTRKTSISECVSCQA